MNIVHRPLSKKITLQQDVRENNLESILRISINFTNFTDYNLQYDHRNTLEHLWACWNKMSNVTQMWEGTVGRNDSQDRQTGDTWYEWGAANIRRQNLQRKTFFWTETSWFNSFGISRFGHPRLERPFILQLLRWKDWGQLDSCIVIRLVQLYSS